MADTRQELDPAKLSLDQLDSMKLDRAKHVLTVVTKLCKEAQRTDGVSIVAHISEDMEQLLIIGSELGARQEREHQKFIKKELRRARNDNTPR